MVAHRPPATPGYGARVLLLSLVALPLVVGCQGCRKDDVAQEGKRPAVEPLSGQIPQGLPGEDGTVATPLKPGHWMGISQAWQSNSEDLRGEVEYRVAVSDGPLKANPSDSSRFTFRRPASLPQGQMKQVESRLLVPFTAGGTQRKVEIGAEFQGKGAAQGAVKIGLPVMAPHEYFFVVLSNRPDDFRWLLAHDWVAPPRGLQNRPDQNQQRDYRLVFPVGANGVRLPDTIFEWTPIAYVLWDDVAPEQLTVDQRRALRDWVHWGGQILFNGPAAATAVQQHEELVSLLPLTDVRSEGIESQRLVTLVENWSLASDRTRATTVGLLSDNTERVGIRGDRVAAAKTLANSGELVIWSRIGRGTVCMTGFDLAAPWFSRWESAQSFFNGPLMHRSKRIYQNRDGVLQLGFQDEPGPPRSDAAKVTSLRILSRDTVFSPMEDTYRPGSSIAAWTEGSDVAKSSLQVLREQAGVEIPDLRFVVTSLMVYLAFLVPINYAVFALVRRPEWAWIAVPVIGCVGAAVIARAARLDIGFARSQTAINLLEVQAGYPRGHLTRFVGIYNSLSSTYELKFSNREAVAVPLANDSQASSDPGYAAATFRHAFKANEVALSGLQVPSNQTATVHAEQIMSLPGDVNWLTDDPSQEGAVVPRGSVRNSTGLALFDAIVVFRDDRGELYFDSIGLLESGQTRVVKLAPGQPNPIGSLPMGCEALLNPLAAGKDLVAGEMRLVGRIEQPLGGLEVQPVLSQSLEQTVIVVNLQYAVRPEPSLDVNLRHDIPIDELFEDDSATDEQTVDE